MIVPEEILKVIKVSPEIICYCECVLFMWPHFHNMSFDLLIVMLIFVTVLENKTKVSKASPEIRNQLLLVRCFASVASFH